MAYTTIDKPTDYFNTILYTGTGSSLANTGVGFQPDWVWIKGRSGATDHGLYDAVRGVTEQLESNNSDAETTEATGLTAFGTDGFTVGALAQLNTSSATYVAWNWLAGTTASGTTNGSKPYSYSANATSGFSIVTYTGNATAGHLIPHGMGKVPRLIHVKSRGDDNGWHSGTIVSASAWNDHGYLYLANAFGTDANQFGATPDTTNFRLGTGTGTNGNNGTRVAYCFADVQGYQKIGSYIGNGNADGTFVYTGFKPAFVMAKATNEAQDWSILDNKRPAENPADQWIAPNSSAAEVANNTTPLSADLLSNGFKMRGSAADGTNGSGDTFIYMAIAENPFVTSTGVPATAR